MASPVGIFISSAPEDEPLVGEFYRVLAPLEREGLIETWSRRNLIAGTDAEREIDKRLRDADVVVLLISPDYLSSDDGAGEMHTALLRNEAGRVVPVIVRPTDLSPAPMLRQIQLLPRGGKPVTTWANRDEAWLDVVAGLRNAIVHRGTPSGPKQPITLPVVPEAAGRPGDEIPIEDIFTTRQPEFTYVEPAQMPWLKADLRVLGPGLVVEGPSGIGKTTAVNKAFEALRITPEKLIATNPKHLKRIDEILENGFTGHVVVDEFHRLDDQRQQGLATWIKIIIDMGERAKLTLIGINPVGQSLTRGFPDVAGRYEVVRLGKQPDDKIAEMIIKGERAANLRFLRRDEFINAAMGSFFTAQRLCAQAAKAAGIFVSQPSLTEIGLGPLDVIKDLLDNTLRSKYHDALLEIATWDETSPPRGATLALLWLLTQKLSHRDEGHVSLDEARHRYPHLGAAFDWLKKSNLTACFDRNPGLKSLFFYNRGAAMLSIEDPQLEFYLRNLPFTELARNSAHRGVRLDPEHGLVIPAPGDAPAPVPASAQFFLHLSDLHFGSEAQARLWYSQLAEDLRELECPRLDALILSGDIANHAAGDEYAAAREFIRLLAGEFKLSPQQVVMVPGNHDVNWKRSEEAYTPQRRSTLKGPLIEGTYIDAGPYVEVRDEVAYRGRFQPFAHFYQAITGVSYPLEYEQQGTLHHFPQHKVLFLGLNSAWQVDHHFRERAGIHTGALAQALTRVRQSRQYEGCLKIAVWHHAVSSPGEDRITDTGFLQALAKAEFRLALHGHVHKADNSRYRHDVTEDGRRLDIICAGTFGAPLGQWLPGYPLQYNLLKRLGDELVVETRCREEPNGAWRPDARWPRGPGKDPAPRYEVSL